jgi:glycosyltransferase involved in cell wall biosynthesis
MPRIGSNPFKNQNLQLRDPEISLAVITHYTEHNYHSRRMDVVRRCLDTMLAGAKDFDTELLIWDNGSTEEFRQMLRGYQPEVLVEAYNVGLDNAKQKICQIASGKVFCVTDDDVEFTPDWLKSQIEILTTYPNVGLVSGSPQRVHFRWGIQSNLAFAKRPDVTLRTGRLIPDEYEADYAISIGMKPEEHAKRSQQEIDFLLEHKGVKAWAHGHHMQFTAYRKTILPFLSHSNMFLADQRPFDIAIDGMGLLRLTTFKRTVRHLGNVL